MLDTNCFCLIKNINYQTPNFSINVVKLIVLKIFNISNVMKFINLYVKRKENA